MSSSEPRRGSEVDDGRHAAPETPLLDSWIHDRYEVLEELGWGSLGHVYLARDHLRLDSLGEPQQVALKVIRRDRLTDKSIAYLKREFRALSRLDHPNVARVHDLDVVPGRGELFFSLELLRGETLVEATQRLGWDRALDLFVQALRALHYVHARGLIHMDMKPKNVYVLPGRGAGLVKVLDFHLALESDDVPDKTMRGTVAYMPPEVVKGDPVDHRADLYGLGAVFYEALTGAPPFADAGNVMDMLRAHARETPPTFAARGVQVPTALESVVLRLLEKAPGDRYPDANAVIGALNTGLNREFELETEETRASYIRTGMFVGRGDELDAALDPARALASAQRAGREPGWQPWIVLLAGADGVGKTRFLNELRVAVQLEGLACLTAEPARLDAYNYGPFRELLTEALRRAGMAERLAALTGQGRLLDPQRVVAAHGKPELPIRVRATEALGDLLREALTRSPLALMIDDVHAADERTLELVQALGSGSQLPLVLYLGIRADHALRHDLGALPGVQVIELAQLTQAATGELLESMLGSPEVPDELVTRLWAMTGGNPRFLEDTMRSLVETRSLEGEGGSLHVSPEAAEQLVPDASLQQLTRRRVSRLDGPTLRLLGACSCSPRPRPLAFAAAVAELSLGQAQRALTDLERRGFAERRGLPGSWAGLGPAVVVEHEPLRVAAHEALGEVTAQLHRQAAHLLESRHPVAAEPPSATGEAGSGGAPGSAAAGGPADRAEELLWHLQRAGDPAAAFPYACQAARAATQRRDFLHARALYAEALALLEQVPEPKPGWPGHQALTIRYAEALAATGQRAEACALLEPLAKPFPRSAEGMRLLGAFLRDQGDLAGAAEHLRTALGLAEQAADLDEDDASLERARCLAELASVALWRGAYAEAGETGAQALAQLEGLGRDDETVPVLDLLYHAARFRGLEEEAGRVAGPRAARRRPAPPRAGRRRPLAAPAAGRPRARLAARRRRRRPRPAHDRRGRLRARRPRPRPARPLRAPRQAARRRRRPRRRRVRPPEPGSPAPGRRPLRRGRGQLRRRRACVRRRRQPDRPGAGPAQPRRVAARPPPGCPRRERGPGRAGRRPELRLPLDRSPGPARAGPRGLRPGRPRRPRGSPRRRRGAGDRARQRAAASRPAPRPRPARARGRGRPHRRRRARRLRGRAPRRPQRAPARPRPHRARPPGRPPRPRRERPAPAPARARSRRPRPRRGRVPPPRRARLARRAAARAHLRRIQDDPEGELEDLTLAMSCLRRIVDMLPADERGVYLEDPDCGALRERFQELR